MSKVVACIIARTVSTRLPLKVLRHSEPGITMIQALIRRVKMAERIDEIYLCTSKEGADDVLEDIAESENIQCYRGSSDEVIERMIAVKERESADYLIRITGDNPHTAYEYLDHQIEFIEENDLDYVRLVNVPIGATAEVIKSEALVKCASSMDPSVSEYLMLFLFDPKNYKCGVLEKKGGDYSVFSVTVDTYEDLERSRKLFSNSGIDMSLNEALDKLVSDKSEKSGIDPDTLIKLPYGKKITYREFQHDYQERIKASLKKIVE